MALPHPNIPTPVCMGMSMSMRLSPSIHPHHPKQLLLLPRACSTPQDFNNSAAAAIERRSANYKPSIWSHEFLETLNNGYQEEFYLSHANTLKNKVTSILEKSMDGPIVSLLELVDDIQRLGMGHLFENEIKITLASIRRFEVDDNDLHATALYFRIFRQHGFKVPQDIFNVFKDPQGNFMESINQDVKGILSLYEASYLGVTGEDILEQARVFAHKTLKNVAGNINSNLALLVNHALDIPQNLGFVRLEARWYIDIYSRRKDANVKLLELAKLDYNMVQAVYQKDAIDISRWWENLGVMKELPFARDRLMECFAGSIGMMYEPQYKHCRGCITKIISFINVIDDIYDIYATLEEARLFTDVVERWDLEAMEELPHYMKLCFFALHNTINEIGYDIFKWNGINVIPYLRKTWENHCKSYLVEATWYNSGYKPSLEEYLDNGWISVGGPLLLLHIYVLMSPKITTKALDYIESYPDIVISLGMILRLLDDLGTYQDEAKRGDVLKSVTCYMQDKGVTEVVAREYIRNLTDKTWKKMNKELWIESPLPKAFVRAVVDLARTTESTYQHGDGVGIPDCETKAKIMSLLVESIHIL